MAVDNSIVVDLARLTSQEIAKREAGEDATQASPLAAVVDPKLAALSQTMQLSGEGTTVALSFTLPAELLQLAMPKPPAIQAGQ